MLTFEEYVAGYLFGMGIDTVPTRKLLEPEIQRALQENSSPQQSYSLDSLQEQETEQILFAKKSRNQLRNENKRKPTELRLVSDPFLFPTMGYDLPISDPNTEIDYMRSAEISLVLLDFDHARYFTKLAYQRGKITEEEYSKVSNNLSEIEKKATDSALTLNPKTKSEIYDMITSISDMFCLSSKHESEGSNEDGSSHSYHAGILSNTFFYSLKIASCEESKESCISDKLSRINNFLYSFPELTSFALYETDLILKENPTLERALEAYELQAKIYTTRDEFDNVIQASQKKLEILDTNKTNPDWRATNYYYTFLDIGDAQSELKNSVEAVSFYKKAEQYASYSSDMVTIGDRMLNLKEYDLAMNMAQRAISLDPTFIDGYGLAGDVIRKKYGVGRNEEEKIYYEKALSLAEEQEYRDEEKLYHNLLFQYYYLPGYVMTPEAKEHSKAYHSIDVNKN